MKITITAFALIFTPLLGIGQETNNNDSLPSQTNVNIIKDGRINEVNDTYRESFVLEGYRIQIFSGNKQKPARNAKSIFINLYSNVKAHEIYEQPHFKIRVGDFRTKLEALKFQREIKAHFPHCFIVDSALDLEELTK